MMSGTRSVDLLFKEFNRIVYGKTDVLEQWNVLFSVFENTRPGYADKIKEH